MSVRERLVDWVHEFGEVGVAVALAIMLAVAWNQGTKVSEELPRGEVTIVALPLAMDLSAQAEEG